MISRYNPEGYHDPTAFAAMISASRQERMDKTMNESARPGEIWIVQSAQGESPALILADDGRIATYIKLRENSMGANDVRIIYQGKMYASPAMLQYTKSDNCVSYEKSVADSEYDAVRGAIADTIGIIYTDEMVVESELMEADTSEIDELRAKVHSLEVSLARCEGERDVYKELFAGQQIK